MVRRDIYGNKFEVGDLVGHVALTKFDTVGIVMMIHEPPRTRKVQVEVEWIQMPRYCLSLLRVQPSKMLWNYSNETRQR